MFWSLFSHESAYKTGGLNSMVSSKPEPASLMEAVDGSCRYIGGVEPSLENWRCFPQTDGMKLVSLVLPFPVSRG